MSDAPDKQRNHSHESHHLLDDGESVEVNLAFTESGNASNDSTNPSNPDFSLVGQNGNDDGDEREEEKKQEQQDDQRDEEDDDEEEAYVKNKRQATKGSKPSSFLAAALGTTAAIRLTGALIDEDDLFTSIGALANAFGGAGGSGAGGGGGAAVAAGGGVGSMPATQVAVLQQMAVAATQNATASVASGTAAAAGAGGGASGVGGAVGAGGAATNSSSAGFIGATSVTAVAAAGIYAIAAGTPLLCPNIPNPDILFGSVSYDFIGVGNRPNESVSLGMASSLIEQYDEMFGCDSEFARRMINCSVPCYGEPSGNFSTATRCCTQTTDEVFGEFVRCTFDCYVHCVGCPFEEPLFLVPDVSASFLSVAPPVGTSLSFSQLYVNESTNEADCSPLCMIGRELESQICSDSLGACSVVRSTIHKQQRLSAASSDVNSTIELSTSEIKLNETVGIIPVETFVPLPSMSPSARPSSSPSREPTATPSQGKAFVVRRSRTRRNQRTRQRGVGLQPTSEPTSRQVSHVVEVSFVDQLGFSHGQVDGAILWLTSLTRGLTIRVDAPSNVETVHFWFDWDKVFEDHRRPFFINSDDGGAPYAPLWNAGRHAVMIKAYGSEPDIIIESLTIYFQVVL